MTVAVLLVAIAWSTYTGLPLERRTISAPVAPAEATARPKPVPVAEHRRPRRGAGAIRVRGTASWHATGRDGLYAAAGPALRRALGRGWRGSRVLVCRVGTRRCVEVRLNDYCPSGERSRRRDKLIDLSDEAFGYLGRLSAGVYHVVVEGFR